MQQSIDETFDNLEQATQFAKDMFDLARKRGQEIEQLRAELATVSSQEESTMQQVIDEAFDNLKQATSAYYQRQIRKVEAKFAHDAAYETGCVSGEIMGKNEVERMGMMRNTYPQLVEDYEQARLAEMNAEMAYRLALLEKERVGLIVQLKEE